MKSFCTTGLILLASLGWMAGTANAQSGDYDAPTLLPMPDAAPVLTEQATYNDSNPSPLETFGSAFSSRKGHSALSQPASSAPTLAAPISDTPAPADPAPAATLPPPAKSATGVLSTSELWDDCASCGGRESCGRWFGSMAGLAMTRNRANPFWTTFNTTNNADQLMNTQNARADWIGGGQVTVGYSFGGCGGCGDTCGCSGCSCLAPALAFTYWQLADMKGFAEVTDPNNLLGTPINLTTQTGQVQINGQNAGTFFDGSGDQRIWRNDRFLNFEINLLEAALVNTGRFQMTALAGFRYFRFEERLTYGSVAGGFNFGDNGGANEAYLSNRVTNNLFGAQIGANFNYFVGDRVNLFFTPKVGIFGNQMNGQTLLYTGDTVNNPTYNIAAHKSDVAFLGELDTGFNWAFARNWSAFAGYRVVGVANVALSDNQFLPYLADTQGFSEIKQNGSLILHGVFAGISWSF